MSRASRARWKLSFSSLLSRHKCRKPNTCPPRRTPIALHKSNNKKPQADFYQDWPSPTDVPQCSHVFGTNTCGAADKKFLPLFAPIFSLPSLPPYPTANAQNAMSDPPSTSSSSIVLLDPRRQPPILSPPPVLPREYRKGNWTLHETLVLIDAKKMDDERRATQPSSKASPSSSSCKTAELRWKWVENYCWSRGCHRSQNQCNDKWDNLLRDYKKVRDYESRPPPPPHDRPSYWHMEKQHRKERNLPSNLSHEVFQALHEVVTRKHSHKTSGPTPPMLPSLPPPPPPPPPLLPPQQQPSPAAGAAGTDSSETEGDGSERQEAAAAEEEDASKKRRKVRSLGTSVVRGASVLARAILACEEKREKRHRDVVALEERKLQMEENRTEMNRQGIAGLITAVNKLSDAIQALASERPETNR